MQFAAFYKAVEKHKTFLISTHVNPDPDALSSQLAMALYLKKLRKKIYMVNDEAVPQRYRFFPGSADIMAFNGDLKKIQFDCAILVDCGQRDRIGRVEELLQENHFLINIDHHVTNEGFGRLNIVVPDRSSTAELIYDILSAERFPVSKDMALLFYLGIMTDTGSFRYENTSAHTHAVVSQLLRFKLPINELYSKLYEKVKMSDFRYFIEIVHNVKPALQGKVICVELPDKALKKFSRNFDVRDKIFQSLRIIEGVEALVIFTEHGKKTRVNFRSQSQVDVARLAMRFNGGGHPRASGCLIDGDMNKAKKKIMTELKKLIV